MIKKLIHYNQYQQVMIQVDDVQQYQEQDHLLIMMMQQDDDHQYNKLMMMVHVYDHMNVM
jgi:hypothetical protein